MFISPRDNMCQLRGNAIPPARMGTLWISDKENSIESIISYQDTVHSELINILSFKELLKQNIDNKVEIRLPHETKSGIIKEIYEPNYLYMLSTNSELGGSYQFIDINNINSLNFIEQPNLNFDFANSTNKVVKTKTENLLDLSFTNSSKKEVTIEFLQKGISWKPQYSLDIINKEEAELILLSEVINDSDEIVNSTINFVIGVPNFKYSETLTDLVDFKDKLNPLYEGQNQNQYLRNTLDEVVVTSGGIQNTVLHDFHIYTKTDVNLPKNSRAHFRLDKYKIKYNHIYECNLPQFQDYENNRNSYNYQTTEAKVFHSLKFNNNSGNLFGEGPVLIIDRTTKEPSPLGQDKLNFTPAGSAAVVKITESPQIEINHKEEIIERTDEITEFWGRKYYKAKIQGYVAIDNYKNENIDLELRYTINGELIDAGVNSEILHQKQPAFTLNPTNRVQWNLKIDRQSKKEINYEFYVYVNR